MNHKNLSQAESVVSSPFNMDRRRFLKILGGGIIIYVAPAFSGQVHDVFAQTGRELPTDFNAFVRINEDGRVSCFTGKIEMGQGIVTSLAQMLAEELDVPLASVHMVMGDTDRCPWDAGTYGSMSVKYFGPPLQAAAAEARTVLIQLAAEHLGVPPNRLETRSGIVVDKQAPDKRVSYGALTKGKRIEKHLGQKPALKPSADYTLSGKSPLRTDAIEKVTGKAAYAGDISLPGMLYARIVRPPAHGASLVEVDTSAAEKVPGAQIVRDRDLAAVLHTDPDGAEKALKLVRVKFNRPQTGLNDGNIHEHLVAKAPPGKVVAEKGDLGQGRGLAAKVMEATYRQGYVAHAPIETHTAIANEENGKLTVRASTQTPFRAQEEVARALGLSPERVRIIAPFVGGGFGGKTRNRQVVEAARLAKLTGKPVQVAWTRAEEFFFDNFMPAAVIKIESGLDSGNRVAFWDYHVYCAGGGRAPTFYDIPHQRTTEYGTWLGGACPHPVEVGPWRAPDANTNTFARESHMDVLAAAARQDPVSFRLAHLVDKRTRRVLEAAASSFGWSSAPAPSGKGQGVACSIYKGTQVAAMAEVDVDKGTGKCRVKRVVLAQDMGRIINPEGAKMQIEGCVMMGLGYALAETIHFRDGEILDRNFETYQIPRFSWMPKIEALLIDNPEMPPQEGGEPAVTCMGAVLANAIFDATGVRLYELPMTPERVKSDLKT